MCGWTRYANNKIEKCQSFYISSCFPGLTQDCFDLSSQFGYDSTPFRSAHVHGTIVLLVSEVYFNYRHVLRFSGYAWHSIFVSYTWSVHAQIVLPWWNACDFAEQNCEKDLYRRGLSTYTSYVDLLPSLMGVLVVACSWILFGIFQQSWHNYHNNSARYVASPTSACVNH